ncbi:glutathione S-transferase T1-like [Asparagus officinalis]|uniref:glutathione S-transferase T1-like n=1 Tax=Asparagus officinalis TaxID=4686 RepID=UPI00098E1EC9|nr:glutathione S-transferase T1-like [Asparagus officinalis]
MGLKLYVYPLSQPSRAILIFCKTNKIDFEEVTVDLSKGEHRSPAYKEINPMRKVPAIVDGGFKLFESHAILSYLACAYPGVADHWYPADLFKRAKINAILDWHHSNLRHGAETFAIYSTLAPLFGLRLNSQAAKEGEKLLMSSLSKIESLWLKGDAKFLLGNLQPSIADLSLVCEIMELEVVDDAHRQRILGPHKKIVQWIENVKNYTNPHFEQVHEALYEVKKTLQSKSSSTAGLNSKL